MPASATEDLELLTFPLDVAPELLRGIAVGLAPDEHRRAQRFRRDRDRRRFMACRARLRAALASRMGIAPSEVEFDVGPAGKPFLSARMPAPRMRFSVSRSRDLGAIAISPDRDLGLDIEALIAIPEADDVAALCLPEADYASYATLPPEHRTGGFMERWTLVEAVAKALGTGIGGSPAWSAEDWTALRFVPAPGYVGTVVVRN